MVNLHEVYLVVKLLLDTAGRGKHLSLLGVFGGEITDRYSWMPRPNKVSGLYLMVLLLEDTALCYIRSDVFGDKIAVRYSGVPAFL